MMPTIEAMIPKARATSGNIITPTMPAEKPIPAFSAAAASEAPRIMAPMFSAAVDSKRSAPRPAQSPTLSPDQVGDDGRVARIVLGDAGLDLAHQVGADVGGLGVDAAAELGEERHEGGAEAVADDEQRDLGRLARRPTRADQGVEAARRRAGSWPRRAGRRPRRRAARSAARR